jgi:hypothetical protein
MQIDKHTYERRYREAFLKGRKPGLFINFVNFHASGSGYPHSQNGSGSKPTK